MAVMAGKRVGCNGLFFDRFYLYSMEKIEFKRLESGLLLAKDEKYTTVDNTLAAGPPGWSARLTFNKRVKITGVIVNATVLQDGEFRLGFDTSINGAGAGGATIQSLFAFTGNVREGIAIVPLNERDRVDLFVECQNLFIEMNAFGTVVYPFTTKITVCYYELS